MPLKNERALLIANAKAGKQGAKNNFFTIVQELSKKYTLTVHLTEDARDAEVVAAQAGEFNTVICSGGDGTVNQVVNGFLRAGIKPAIGYLPSGTANDLATSFGLSRDTETDVATILNGKPIAHDIGRLNNRHFVYIASFGAFTKVSYETSQDLKNLFGHFAYILSGASELINLSAERVSVKWEGGEIKNEEIYFLGVMNTLSVGGMIKLPKKQVGFSDGKMEMIIIKKPKNLTETNNLLLDLMKGRLADGDNGNIVFAQSCHFEVHTQKPMAWTVDGEGTDEMTDVVIDVLPGAVNFIR